MDKAYSRITWENDPSQNTPLNASNLNKMDAALNTVDTRVVDHDYSIEVLESLGFSIVNGQVMQTFLEET